MRPRLLSDLPPKGRKRLEPLLARGWSLPAAREHPLARLQGRALGGHRLLVLLGPKNSVGARYFQLFLVDRRGRLSDGPIALGLHNSGPYPGYNWIDLIRFDAAPAFGGESVDLRVGGQERRLFRLLLELVPAGGHLMVEYESPTQRESERILGLGYPAASSPLGYLLFSLGCRSFRDWYISEGGREGPRKLQGFKPLDEEAVRQRVEALRQEMAAALSRRSGRERDAWGRTARRLARSVLRALEHEHDPTLRSGRREPGA